LAAQRSSAAKQWIEITGSNDGEEAKIYLIPLFVTTDA